MIDPRFANAGAVPFASGVGVQQMPAQYHRSHRQHRHHRKNKHGLTAASPISRDESIHKVDHEHQEFQNEGNPIGSGVVDTPYGAGDLHQQLLTGKQRHRRQQISQVLAANESFQEGVEGGHRSRKTQGHHHHHHHHHGGGSDGYGHINEDLIFIERGDHSPHRQQPPPGYEYKGKIEVQGCDQEFRSKAISHGIKILPTPQPLPLPPVPPPTISTGPCPPGWLPVAVPSISCPPGTVPVGGQGFGGGGFGFGVGGGAGSFGLGGGGGLANLAAQLPFPPQGQLIADYIVESTSGGSYGGSGGSYGGSGGSYGGSGGGGFIEGGQTGYTSTGRATIIEVWQKKRETKARSRSSSSSSSSSRSHTTGPSFDFNGFRNEILAAIDRISKSGGGRGPSGHDGGTQTQIDNRGDYTRPSDRPRTPSSGEVRVIVQPIQPVFYMPRQTDSQGPSHTTHTVVAPSQPAAPQVVYIPRNVYVPVIKPVFVPRERVIVRPQVIHVARPVLVDRPVPVTQRPIIIDRERPIPVPVRTAEQATGQAGGARTIREEYVYRDNLPVAYGGRCSEYAGGINYGYMPTEQSHQYAAGAVQEYEDSAQQYDVTSTQEISTGCGVTGQANNFTFQEHSAGHVTSQGGAGSIDVLDPTVTNTWQRTDTSSFVSRYGGGGPIADLMQKGDQVEQQMYQELRQQSSSGGIQRSYSTGSYGSSSGVAHSGGCQSGMVNY